VFSFVAFLSGLGLFALEPGITKAQRLRKGKNYFQLQASTSRCLFKFSHLRVKEISAKAGLRLQISDFKKIFQNSSCLFEVLGFNCPRSRARFVPPN
jgi:hypothetical protein